MYPASRALSTLAAVEWETGELTLVRQDLDSDNAKFVSERPVCLQNARMLDGAAVFSIASIGLRFSARLALRAALFVLFGVIVLPCRYALGRKMGLNAKKTNRKTKTFAEVSPIGLRRVSVP